MIKAFVMAAGAGTRLAPLTQALPKPMVPILNKPVLEHVLENLSRQGFQEAILNLHSHPEMIRRYFGEGRRLGLKLLYSHEPNLMGTAGGVGRMRRHLAGATFLVLSGDGLSDVDLSSALAFHRKKRALATMLTAEIDSRLEYGLVLSSRAGRIQRFIEKPKWGDVFGNTVNTGIYIFEPEIFRYIPRGIYDFGKQLWPKLLRLKKGIFAYKISDYWCDVGNLSEYRRSHRDALSRKVRVAIPGREVRRGVWIEEGTRLMPRVKLEPPCLIGKNSLIGEGAVIGPWSSLGEGARVGKKAVIRNSILWNHVEVASHVHLDNCIISHNARVLESLSVYAGAVLAPRPRT